MYLVVSFGDETLYWGPFPDKDRANKYAEDIRADMSDVWRAVVHELIDPDPLNNWSKED